MIPPEGETISVGANVNSIEWGEDVKKTFDAEGNVTSITTA